ncbi:unnamed protein product [Linum tenue]|uniref:F-box domain-containing protein n=2 Tax=Linum tenue TaxID=586396 RepID=A0AAV0NJ30_9ROSI|nr:unnamed protein product [Linum tenue]
MKRVCELGADRITNLPVDVIHRILVLLTTKDAAKMATLSTKWRGHWRTIPQLQFAFYENVLKKDRSRSNEIATKLISNIHKVLLVHDGPIAKFQLSVDGLMSCDGIDQIIYYLSNRGLQELALDFSASCIYKLHSSLFNSLYLNSLSLSFCEFRQPPWVVGFSKLTCLSLAQVTLSSDFFESFLLKCPMVQNLSLTSCEGPSNHEIVVPCLKKFFFFGGSQKLHFKCTPLLEVVSILSVHEKVDKPADMVALFATLPALKRVAIDFKILECLAAGVDNLSTGLPTPLHQLKFLHICYLDLGCSLKKARDFVCLIMSSPNLLELTIELDRKQLNQRANKAATSSIGTLLKAESGDGSGCCLQHLRVFRLEFCHGTQVELELVRFVLATAPLLGKLYITPHRKWGPNKASKFMQEVMQYQRVSKEIKIRYKCFWDCDPPS